MKTDVAQTTSRRIVARPYQGDDDFWKLRQLLIETYPLTPTGYNWDMRRWDGRRFHHGDALENDPNASVPIRFWEREDGKLVAAVHPDGAGDACLQLHPDYRHLEAEMVDWAEAHLPVTEEGKRRLDFSVFDYDRPRQRLLTARGYVKMPWIGVTRRLRFGDWPLPVPQLAAGYTLRTTRADERDYEAIAALLNAAFNRTFHAAADYRTFTGHSPSFRHDLNLVAEEDSTGTLAAHVGIAYDEANRRGIFEPVCTHPAHQRKGLARTLMFEGLWRLKALGAADVMVDTGDMIPANELYDAVGFTEAYTACVWQKVW